MKCAIPEISWHNRDPVLSIDFQPQKENENFCRLASGGTDSHVLIWRVYVDEEENTTVEFVSDLTRHQKAVNAVRFSPNGELLATGDDESAIVIWRQKQDTEAPELPGPSVDTETLGKEQWTALRSLRGHLEDVYDLSWSPDSNCLVSGSVDNTAIVWDVQKGAKLGYLDGHKGFVQGVAWDPLGQYLATLCSDRKMRVFNAQSRKLVSQVDKCLLPVPKGNKLEGKQVKAFHDDTIQSFFRRLCFSPDGQILIAPSGVIEPQQQGEESSSTTLVFGRNSLNRPVIYLPWWDKYSVCVKCCPVLFELRNLDPSTKPESMLLLPYRVVFAVATVSAVVLYDTQQPMPFGYISNLHYTRLTDLAWSSCGDILMVSSTDGYCSVITFSEGELGVPYKKKDSKAAEQPNVSPIKEEVAKTVEDIADKQTPNIHDTKHQDTITIEDEAIVTEVASTAEKIAEEKAVEDNTEKILSATEKEVTKCEENSKCVPEGSNDAPTGVSVDEKPSDLQSDLKAKLTVSDKVVTPTDSGKKARRVQLITLSSPKSKKKL